ncbi:MAG: glycolate oxidase subunit GlcF [Gammaproteobacteria bacterium]|nr:glycolate oxidase subunit GlcF [Gammaproteobacteria bacterium]
MQTRFSAAQLSDPATRAMDAILRKCVHCGFCNAACPTFRLTGDELDSPRGRIYLIKDMLEGGTMPAASAVTHIDRCLSCLACTSACPSGVDYMHLVDHARAVIHESAPRNPGAVLLRSLLAAVLPHPRRLRTLVVLGHAAKFMSTWFPAPAREWLEFLPAPEDCASASPADDFSPATSKRRGSVALLAGCVQQVFGREINAASVRLLNGAGFDVHLLPEVACCGAIEHHLGRTSVLGRIRDNVRGWDRRLKEGQFSTIVINASGCGTMVKDYAHLLSGEPKLAADAARVSGAAADISEFLCDAGFPHAPPVIPRYVVVACQNPCSMQHGQNIRRQPADLLRHCGFSVRESADDHACCGSAGTYNLLQGAFASKLGRQKGAALRATGAQVIASGNLGCMLQIRRYVDIPVVHTVQLLDWASGGPLPSQLSGLMPESSSLRH